ncbi:MAG: hypothetical protein KGK10_02125 [Rhodospirillales bacterium]|nr:hypothetical protein [Rhodospirillales bacterium]
MVAVAAAGGEDARRCERPAYRRHDAGCPVPMFDLVQIIKTIIILAVIQQVFLALAPGVQFSIVKRFVAYLIGSPILMEIDFLARPDMHLVPTYVVGQGACFWRMCCENEGAAG